MTVPNFNFQCFAFSMTYVFFLANWEAFLHSVRKGLFVQMVHLLRETTWDLLNEGLFKYFSEGNV